MIQSHRSRRALCLILLFGCSLAPLGCQSPYYADRGAGVGALAGAGAGALIGDAAGGNAGAGALLGAGLGAITGATVGGAMDDMQAQNRAEIAAQMGRQIQAGAATIDEVIAMTQSGVDPRLIQNYVRTSGVARPLTAADVIYLTNQGVSPDVIQVMQAPPMQHGPPMVAGPPVIVQEHYHSPYWGPPPPYYYGHYYRRPAPRVGWGVSIAR